MLAKYKVSQPEKMKELRAMAPRHNLIASFINFCQAMQERSSLANIYLAFQQSNPRLPQTSTQALAMFSTGLPDQFQREA